MTARKRYDLGQARAARAEARGNPEPDVVNFGTVDYELPPEMPLEALELLVPLMADEDDAGKPQGIKVTPALFGTLYELLSLVVGDEGITEFRGKRPSDSDLLELLDYVLDVYGMSPGKSEDSRESSPDTSESSSPTSSTATASTSEKPSTAPETPA